MFAWVQSCAPRSYLVDSGSRGFTQTLILVLVYIRVRVVSLGRDMGGRVHSGSRGFTLMRLEVVGFILFRVGSLGRA